MAKDGTIRGGARAGAGRKRKAASDKLLEGRELNIIEMPKANEHETSGQWTEHIKQKQYDGTQLHASDVKDVLCEWLEKFGCRELVPEALIDAYSQSEARWMQCENAISDFGLLAAHPTTGAPITSPYVGIAQGYMKQVNQLWYSIYQIVKENSTGAVADGADIMEGLLSRKRG